MASVRSLLQAAAPRASADLDIERLWKRGRRQRIFLHATTLASVLLVAIGLWAVIETRSNRQNSAEFAPSKRGGGAQAIRLGDGVTATAVEIGSGKIWAAAQKEGGPSVIFQIDATTHNLLGQIPFKEQPTYLSYGEGSLWVASSSGGATLYRIDPQIPEVEATIDLPGDSIGAIEVGAGAVWIETLQNGDSGKDSHPAASMVRLDPRTNEVASITSLPALIQGYDDMIVVGRDAVWVLGVRLNQEDVEQGGEPVRIDPDTGDLVSQASVRAFSIGEGAGQTWVAGPADGENVGGEPHRWVLQRLDRTNNQPTGVPVSLPGPRSILAVTDSGVWLAGYDEAEHVSVERFNPQTGEVEAAAQPVASLYSGAVYDGTSQAVWMATVHSVTRVSID